MPKNNSDTYYTLQARREIILAFDLLSNAILHLKATQKPPHDLVRGLEIIMANKTNLLNWFESN